VYASSESSDVVRVSRPSAKGQGHRSKTAWHVIPSPTFATDMAQSRNCSKVKSISLHYNAADRHVRTSNCLSAAGQSGVRTSNFRSADRQGCLCILFAGGLP